MGEGGEARSLRCMYALRAKPPHDIRSTNTRLCRGLRTRVFPQPDSSAAPARTQAGRMLRHCRRSIVSAARPRCRFGSIVRLPIRSQRLPTEAASPLILAGISLSAFSRRSEHAPSKAACSIAYSRRRCVRTASILTACRVPSCKRVTAAYLSFGCKRCCKVSVCITTSAPARFNRRRAVRCCDFNVSAANPARASRMSGFGARSGDSFGTDGCIRLCF